MKYTIAFRQANFSTPILAVFYMQRSMTESRFKKQFMHELAIQRCIAKGLMLDDPLQELMIAMQRAAAAFYGRVDFEYPETELIVEA